MLDKKEGKCTIYLGVGSSITATMRDILLFICKYKMIDMLVITGSALDHDCFNVFDDNIEFY